MTEELEVQELEVQEDVFTTVVKIGDEEFEITPLNAKKTTYIANMFGRLLLAGKMKLKDFSGLKGNDLPFAILAAVDEEMLVGLAATLIGSDVEFARENFELEWVMEALVVQTRVSNLDTVIRNFTLLVTQIV